jgi:DNA-binding MarR family transcriptional regulator
MGRAGDIRHFATAGQFRLYVKVSDLTGRDEVEYRMQNNKSGKYVNMADVISPDRGKLSDEDVVGLIELLFFAYRDFVSDPDQILAEYKFGRAHHRVLHFTGRNPGMTVAQLLEILGITKQSLSRVLKELIDKGFVRQKEGLEDRRQRLLFLTPEGEKLHERLMAPQISRIRRALSEAGPEAELPYRQVLYYLIDPVNRDSVRNRIEAGKMVG